MTGCICLQVIIISQFDQYDNNKRPLIMKKKIIQFEKKHILSLCQYKTIFIVLYVY